MKAIIPPFLWGAFGFLAGCLAVNLWQGQLIPSDGVVQMGVQEREGSPELQRAQLSPTAEPHGPNQACPPTTVVSRESATTASARSLDALLREIVAPPGKEPPDPFAEALRLLQSSPDDRAELMERYARETDKFARGQMRMLLMNLQNEDVVSFAANLTSDADPKARAEGYTLLRLTQESSESARKAILNAVEVEHDPHALAEAVASLMPGESPDVDEAASIVDKMKRLSQHSSPEVRGESMLALSRWDRGANKEELIYNGLTDKHAPVRSAAFTMLAENNVRTDRVKTALIDVAFDGKAGPRTRMVAADALGGFNLTQQERHSLLKLRDGLPPVRSVDDSGN